MNTDSNRRERYPMRHCADNEQATRSPLRDRFLILAREAGLAAESLRGVLEPLGKVEVIVDSPVAALCERRGGSGAASEVETRDDGDSLAPSVTDRRYIRITNEEVEGYEGMMGRQADLPLMTAWSRAMVHLSRTFEPDEAVWFVEDDVAGDEESFSQLVIATQKRNADLSAWDIQTKAEDPYWYFWPRADGFFEDPCRAFQPLCRVSPELLRKILDFQKRHGRFIFHEVLFASLVREAGMGWLDWSRDSPFRDCFSTFCYRPEARPVERGISHPVKNMLAHEAVCHFTDVAESERAGIYVGSKCGWYSEDFGRWRRAFITDQPMRILETGVSNGVSANLLLDDIFVHPESELHGIDLYEDGDEEHTREDFEANSQLGGHAGQLHLYEGTTREVLAWMIAADGFWESFDFIHLSCAENAAELLADACQAWSLLKSGGVLVFGGTEREKPGVDAFLSVFGERLERVFSGKRMVVMKHVAEDTIPVLA